MITKLPRPNPNRWYKVPELYRVYLYETAAEKEYIKQQKKRYNEKVVVALRTWQEDSETWIMKAILGAYIWLYRIVYRVRKDN